MPRTRFGASGGHRDGELALGLDVGSTAVKVVVLGADGTVLERHLRALAGDLAGTVREALEAARGAVRAGTARLALTGQGRLALGELSGAVVENEILCLLRGAAAAGSRASSVIEVGGQSSRWIALERGGQGGLPGLAAFALNDQCAAGAGAFLTQQAGRLKMDVAQFSQVAAAAKTGAAIAGRCAVFAKSDMIHLQQKGVPVSEVAYGLCLALARNFLATVLKGREAPPPVALAGGGALNAGLVRAFQEILGPAVGEVEVVPEPVYVGAHGAATLARELGVPVDLEALIERLQAKSLPARGPVPGQTDDARVPHAATAYSRGSFPALSQGSSPVLAFLGIDLGSVSTDLALVAPDGTVVDGVYLPTRGRPIDVLREGLEILWERYGARLQVLGAAGTLRAASSAQTW
jgi:predicted CoA-substrate-specific enzyme activase